MNSMVPQVLSVFQALPGKNEIGDDLLTIMSTYSLWTYIPARTIYNSLIHVIKPQQNYRTIIQCSLTFAQVDDLANYGKS